MYKIYADDTLIYDSTLEDYKIGKGQITKEAGKSGSFVFSVYPDHPYYNSFVQLKTVITVYKRNRIVFRGRVLDDSTDYWNNKVLTCEGELGFLQDSIVRPFEFTGTPAELFTQWIQRHNSQVDSFKQFKIGSITVTDPNDYIARSSTDYETTLDSLTSRTVESGLGGVIYITHGDDGQDEIPTIHYLTDYPDTAEQSIEFGVNLKDYTKKVSSTELATAIIPLGAELENGDGESTGERLTIESVNDGKDYIYSSAAVALRGWVFKPVEWDDVTQPENLLTKAQEYLQTVVNQAVTVELTAIDLSLLDRSIESYGVEQYIHVTSAPHGFDSVMLCNKQTIDLLAPENDSLVLGRAYSSFTEASTKAINNAVKRESSQVSAFNKTIVDIISRLDVLEGISITVSVTDSLSSLSSLLTTYGALTVAGKAITADSTVLVVNSKSVEVTYTLSSALSTARTVKVDGVSLGTVSASGNSVTTSVSVSSGSTITVEFTT